MWVTHFVHFSHGLFALQCQHLFCLFLLWSKSDPQVVVESSVQLESVDSGESPVAKVEEQLGAKPIFQDLLHTDNWLQAYFVNHFEKVESVRLLWQLQHDVFAEFKGMGKNI